MEISFLALACAKKNHTNKSYAEFCLYTDMLYSLTDIGINSGYLTISLRYTIIKIALLFNNFFYIGNTFCLYVSFINIENLPRIY